MAYIEFFPVFQREDKFLVDHSQGKFMRSGHQGNQDWKWGLGVQVAVQTTKSLRAVAVFACLSLTFDLVTRLDLAD